MNTHNDATKQAILNNIYASPPTARPWRNHDQRGIALVQANTPNRIQVWIPTKDEAARLARELIDLALNPTTWETTNN